MGYDAWLPAAANEGCNSLVFPYDICQPCIHILLPWNISKVIRHWCSGNWILPKILSGLRKWMKAYIRDGADTTVCNTYAMQQIMIPKWQFSYIQLYHCIQTVLYFFSLVIYKQPLYSGMRPWNGYSAVTIQRQLWCWMLFSADSTLHLSFIFPLTLHTAIGKAYYIHNPRQVAFLCKVYAKRQLFLAEVLVYDIYRS